MLVVEPNLPDPEILFICDCNPGVLYTHSPCLGVRGNAPKNGVRGQRPRDRGVQGQCPRDNGGSGAEPLRKKNWDVCWSTILRTHDIGLTLEFSHCISPIKESIVK